MPHGSTHTRQKRKNLILLGVLLGVVALLFVMTTVKLGIKAEHDAVAAPATATAQ